MDLVGEPHNDIVVRGILLNSEIANAIELGLVEEI